MKKVLLASTVLAMTATVAAAEVTLSGDARMGVLNGIVHGAGLDETGFTSRARVSFTMSGETDGGLAFGASFRADNAAAAAGGTAGSVFISGAFGKLSMGDVDGAANAAVGHVDGVGLTGLGDTNENTFIANGGSTLAPLAAQASSGDPSALYEYSAGALSVYASVTNPAFNVVSPGGAGNLPAGTYDGIAYGLGAAYSMDAYKFSLGYENVNVKRFLPAAPALNVKADHWILGADATFGQVTVKARYGKANAKVNGVSAADFKQAALSATYSQDALGVTGFIAQKKWETAAGANISKVDSMGIGASYSLGGGATLKAGIVSQEQKLGAAASTKDTAFDFGVAFSF